MNRVGQNQIKMNLGSELVIRTTTTTTTTITLRLPARGAHVGVARLAAATRGAAPLPAPPVHLSDDA